MAGMERGEIQIETPEGILLKSIPEWQELSTREKINYVREGEVQLLIDGEPVPMREAMPILRARR